MAAATGILVEQTDPADALADCPTDRVRNVCILAHVDHGKTTCADNLICANGIISRHSAGKVRYLDSRQDEQERQITMKSSAIALKWVPVGKPMHTINLIDSPGHVDFTSEVSTAARLADGAFVVVDVVEGVEAQTRTVLRQAWRDRVKTCLVINKIDRLIVELDLTPLEAYQRIVNLLEQVNAINQQLLAEELMAMDTEAVEAEGAGKGKLEGSGASTDGIDLTTALEYYDEAVEQAWRYSPERGNVAFASGYHGWGFRISTFAELVAGKMGAKPAVLHKVLWGEWCFNPKTKRAMLRSRGDTKTKPMFVQFVLEQLWRVYSISYKSLDLSQLTKMQAQIPGWKDLDLSRLVVGTSATRELLSRWLPFADCVLEMAVDHLPSPRAAAPDRLPVLCPRWFAASTTSKSGSEAEAVAAAAARRAVQLGAPPAVVDGLQKSDPAAPVVVYLAKFLSADLERFCLAGDVLVGGEELQFVGICRVFSGTIRPNQELSVMSSAEGGQDSRSGRSLRVHRLFLLKGRVLEEVSEVPAGFIAAAQVSEVGGTDPGTAGAQNDSELGVERCLTLCSEHDGPCFETPYCTQAFAIVRVNIEPQKISDADALYKGLRLLHRADPSVTIDVRVTGENLLGCCGDEHLKRCITDLQNLYARGVPLRISPPLVAVRESIAPTVNSERLDPKAPMWLPSWALHFGADASTEASSHFSGDHEDGASDTGVGPSSQPIDRFSMSSAGVTSAWTANRKVCVRISAMALPTEVLQWMDSNADVLETVVHDGHASPAFICSRDDAATLQTCFEEISRQFDQRMTESSVEEGVASVGLGGGGGNSSEDKPSSICGLSVAKGSRTVLLDATGGRWKLGEDHGSAPSGAAVVEADVAEQPEGAEWVPIHLRSSILAGYQFASCAGPLCEEPMRGVAFVIHACHVSSAGQSATATQQPRPGENATAAALGGYTSDEPPVQASPRPVAPPMPTAATLAMAADPYGPMSGQVMVATKEACRCCLFRRAFARISEAMLSLEVQCEQEMLGKVYGVLGKRRVKVLEEGLREGSSTFYIKSHLPLADSFGMALDLRSAASGQISFHCAFSHWEQSDDDPFQEASLTAEEIEELGDQPLQPNMAKKLIDAIRKRKGLATDEKVVKDATKQRTVKRNK
eukprot:TRINITY_DN68859_c0_g1_i1.p1 TRINITY_DN68859_c0_g1~~TRINITY_DN68859_c0_g1_i1.p1  ORF type:complete len:1204 (+),score=224.66 TRINITY_DN68859_c0_g1_i1:171-3614(+)